MDHLDETEIDVMDPLSVDEEDNSDVVILEVSSVGGRQSTKLIEPPSKRKKLEPPEENVSSTRGKVESEPMEMEQNTWRNTSFPTSDDPRPVNGMPIMVKEGDKSRLMYLYSSPQAALPEANAQSVATPITSRVRRNDDMLIERLKVRIKELETKILDQRDLFKLRLSKIEEKHRNKIELLNRTVAQLKAQPTKLVPPVKMPKVPPPDTLSNCPNHSIQDVIYSALKDRFSRNQIKAMIEKDTMIRWDDSDLLKAYTLRCISYGAYIFLRDQLKYPLPSMKYLTRWLGKHQPKKEVAVVDIRTMDGDNNFDYKTEDVEPGRSDQALDKEELEAEEELTILTKIAKQPSEDSEVNSEEVDLVIADGSLDDNGVIERYILVTPRENSSPNGGSGSKLVRAVRTETGEFHYLPGGDSENFIQEVYIVREKDDDANRIESEHSYQLSAQEGSVEH